MLEYNTPLTTDTIADQVYGQPDLTTFDCSQDVVTASSLCGGPFSMGLDPAGNLYISDNNNDRVLEYNNPLSNNTADLVFGQLGSFTSRGCNNGGVSASSSCGPLDVKADSNGNVYVADPINNRVLEYAAHRSWCSTMPPAARNA